MVKKINDAELKALLNAQFDLANAESANNKISDRRRTNLQRYRGELYGNERAGRSRVVDWSAYDTVESTKPALLKIFAGTDKIAEYEPVSKEDEEYAKQATDYGNFVFMNDNDGFNIMCTWMHDGFVSINGYVKIFWDEVEQTETKEWQGITQEQLAKVMSDLQGRYSQEGALEVLEQAERIEALPDGQQMPVYDIKVKCISVKKFVRIVNCAPEDVGKASGTTDMDECRYSYHRDSNKTVTDIIEMGFSREMALEAAKASGEGNGAGDERSTRSQFEDDTSDTISQAADESMRMVTYTEHYIRFDYDGDGKAEYRVIKTGGDNNSVIFENEELSECPLVDFTPIPLPYQSFGMALVEPALPIAEIKTTIQRQILDNFYCINNSSHLLNQNLANENTIPDLLNSIPNRIIRAESLDAVKPFDTKPLGPEPFTLLEYMDTLLEQRTGVTRYNQGLDADSLNKTATGINAIMGAAQERQMMIARHFASSLKKLFGKILRLTIKHQDIPRTMRLRNKWVTVDPSYWNANMDTSITVGLGTGNKDQQLIHLTALLDRQVTQLQPLGIVQPQHILHTAEKMVENMGFKNTEAFVPTDEQWQQTQQEIAQQPPQEDPAVAQARAESEAKMAMEQQKMAADQQVQQTKMQFEQEKAAAEHAQRMDAEQQKLALEMEKTKAQLEMQERVEMARLAMEERLAMMRIEAEATSKIAIAKYATDNAPKAEPRTDA